MRGGSHMTSDGIESLDNQLYYQTWGSWSFCDLCGRRRVGAAPAPPLSGRYAAPAISRCQKCPLSWEALEQEATAVADTGRLYVAPQESDWPRYDPAQEAYVLTGAPPLASSMLALTKEERESLAPLALFCDYKALRGQSGKAAVANIKNPSVIRAA